MGEKLDIRENGKNESRRERSEKIVRSGKSKKMGGMRREVREKLRVSEDLAQRVQKRGHCGDMAEGNAFLSIGEAQETE